MATRPITDDLLNLTIDNKRDQGVGAARIHTLIEAFAAEELSHDEAENIVGFLWVESIPHDRRATFLTALLALAPDPEGSVSSLRRPAPPSVSPFGALLTRARTVLRLAAA